MQLKGIIFASITAILWGFLAIMLKVTVNEIPVLTIVWIRFTIAFFILLIYFLIKSPQQISILWSPPTKLIIIAFLLTANYIGFNKGLEFTSPVNAQVFIQSGPLLLALAGLIIFKEKLSFFQIVGFLLAIVGFAIFYSEQLSFALDKNYSIGILYLLFGGASWAIYSILQKQMVKIHPAQQLNLFIYALPVVVLAPFVDFKIFSSISLTNWVLLFIMGVNTLIAYGCLALALKYLEATKVSIIITLNPIITFVTMSILGALSVSWIKYESLTFTTITGAFLVLAGAIAVLSFSKKKLQKHS